MRNWLSRLNPIHNRRLDDELVVLFCLRFGKMTHVVPTLYDSVFFGQSRLYKALVRLDAKGLIHYYELPAEEAPDRRRNMPDQYRDILPPRKMAQITQKGKDLLLDVHRDSSES
jgi:hypothetical protein